MQRRTDYQGVKHERIGYGCLAVFRGDCRRLFVAVLCWGMNMHRIADMNNEPIIWGRTCVNHPDLSLTVSRTLIGTYRVTFRDDDGDQTIEQRIFVKCIQATEYAHKLVLQA